MEVFDKTFFQKVLMGVGGFFSPPSCEEKKEKNVQKFT